MSKQIRILVDCHVFDGTFQGTTTYLKGIYSAFILDKSYRFFLASNDSKNLETIFGTHENVTYVDYKYSNKYLRLLFNIPSIIKTYKIDFAHFQYIVPPFKSCRYIVTIHDILFMEFPQYFPLRYRLTNRFLFKWSGLTSDIVLTVSSYSKNMIKEHFKIDEVIVTPNAVDPIYFEEYNKVQVVKEVLKKYGIKDYWIYISRWEPRKNHHSLLKVFVENGYYQKFYLVFVGNEAIENREFSLYFKSLTTEVKSKIVFLRNVEFDELVTLLRGSNLSVYPSFAEGFGIPPLEALAARVPSICSKTTGMSDFTFMESMRFDPDNLPDIKACIDANINSKVNNDVLKEMKKSYNWSTSLSKLKNAIENFV